MVLCSIWVFFYLQKTHDTTIQQLRLQLNMSRLESKQLQRQNEALQNDDTKELHIMVTEKTAEVSTVETK